MKQYLTRLRRAVLRCLPRKKARTSQAAGKRLGFIFIVTVVGMGVMLVLGAGFMGSASQQLANANNDYAGLHAMAMSSAGAHYAFWVSKYGGGIANTYQESFLSDPRQIISAVNPTVNYQLHKVSPFDPDDEFYVWIAQFERIDPDDPTKKGAGYLAVSKGLFRAQSSTSDDGMYRGVRAVWAKDQGKPGGNLPIALKYALFSHYDLYMTGGATVKYGDVGSNYGDLTLKHNVNLIGGSGKIFYSTPGQQQNPADNKSGYPVIGGQPESFKTWDWTTQDFKNAARWEFTGDHIPTNGNDFFPDTANPYDKKNIAFVTGDVSLSRDYLFTKSGTIVIDGDLTVHGNIYTSGPGVSIVLYCLGNSTVKINGGATLQAALIAHNDNFSGSMDLDINGNAEITGAILADRGVRMNGGFTINYVRPGDQSPVEPPQPANVGDGFLSWEVF